MSKLSIYETNWIDLVFENKNKEYGAYQLRQESTKTSLFALFMGLLLCVTLMSVPKILSFFSDGKSNPVAPPEMIDQIIHVTNILPNKIKKIDKPVQPKIIEQKAVETITKKQLVNPIIVHAPEATPEIAKNTENNIAKTPTTEGLALPGLNSTTSQGVGTESGESVDYGNTIVTNTLLDQLPEFPGGINKFYTYIGRNFESPEINEVRNIRIYVSFVVEKDGSMTDIQVKNDPGYGLGKEAIRVLKSLRTKWTPGVIDSKAVRTAYNLPITVQTN